MAKTGLPFFGDIFDNGSSNAGTRPRIVPTGNIKTDINITGVGGIRTGQTTYDKTLSAILSGLALWKGANYVPTNTVPAGLYSQQQQQGLDANTLALLAAQNRRDDGGGSTGENIERFIKENTGLLLIGGIIFAAFMMKPPRR